MGDTTEQTRTEKAYCCSNYPQTEASLIAKFDLGLLIIGLIGAIISVAAVATDEDPPPPLPGKIGPVPHVYNETLASDPSYFFYWSMSSQLLVLSLILVLCVIRLIFTVLLLIGVYTKKHAFLLTWFISTCVTVLVLIIVGIIATVYATSKATFSASVITYFLYKWYCLWIVKLLMSEIRSVRAGYANPLEDSGEIEQANNLMPPSDSFTVDKF